jgi:hypothetical protein
MKSTKISLKDLLNKKHLHEAEEEKPAEGGEEENPFAAAEEEGGDKGEEGGGEDKGEEGGDKKEEKPAGIPLKFNISKVKQYNDAKFLSDTGTVKSIDKKGIVVTTQPDGVDVLVNFSDIENMSESVKKFFKQKK